MVWPISPKKVLFAILIVVALSQYGPIRASLIAIYSVIADALKPLGRSPENAKLAVACLFLALIWITAFRLLYTYLNRKKGDRT